MPRAGSYPDRTHHASSVLTVLCWKWGTRYRSEHVNALRQQVARYYARPHQFACVTNDAAGLDGDVAVIPDPEDFAALRSPHGAAFPACYRRLRMFADDAATRFGERFVCLDVDLVLVGDVAPLWDRPEDFVGYRDPLYPRQLNGSMLLLRAGTRPDVWRRFDPAKSPAIARAAGYRGSDQSWLSYCLAGVPTWGPETGVYSYRKDVARNGLPADARVVVFHGNPKPWDAGCSAINREYYSE